MFIIFSKYWTEIVLFFLKFSKESNQEISLKIDSHIPYFGLIFVSFYPFFHNFFNAPFGLNYITAVLRYFAWIHAKSDANNTKKPIFLNKYVRKIKSLKTFNKKFTNPNMNHKIHFNYLNSLYKIHQTAEIKSINFDANNTHLPLLKRFNWISPAVVYV